MNNIKLGFIVILSSAHKAKQHNARINRARQTAELKQVSRMKAPLFALRLNELLDCVWLHYIFPVCRPNNLAINLLKTSYAKFPITPETTIVMIYEAAALTLGPRFGNREPIRTAVFSVKPEM